MRAFAGWLTRFIAPKDKRFNAVTWLPIGNAVLPQNSAGALLAYASELKAGDPLRDACIAVYQQMEQDFTATGYDVALMAAMAPPMDQAHRLAPLTSEHLDELGVTMRHAHPSEQQSCLFQKIGFWKDHYENDETSINWYAKGTPLVMDYGTYTGKRPRQRRTISSKSPTWTPGMASAGPVRGPDDQHVRGTRSRLLLAFRVLFVPDFVPRSGLRGVAV